MTITSLGAQLGHEPLLLGLDLVVGGLHEALALLLELLPELLGLLLLELRDLLVATHLPVGLRNLQAQLFLLVLALLELIL